MKQENKMSNRIQKFAEKLGRYTLSLLAAILLGGAIIFWQGGGTPRAFLLISLIYAAVGIGFQNNMFIALSVLALSLGSGLPAIYKRSLGKPIETIAFFSTFAIAAYMLSKCLDNRFRDLALTASKTAFFLVNIGLAVGSIWGEKIYMITITPALFVLPWYSLILLTGLWAGLTNNRWIMGVLIASFILLIFSTVQLSRVAYVQDITRLAMTHAPSLI